MVRGGCPLAPAGRSKTARIGCKACPPCQALVTHLDFAAERASEKPRSSADGYGVSASRRADRLRERASHVQRLQRTLEDANIKLDSAISGAAGVSGRAMIQARIEGETDPARLDDRRLRTSPDTLREGLRGRVTSHHRFLLSSPAD